MGNYVFGEKKTRNAVLPMEECKEKSDFAIGRETFRI